ncbi:MAG: MFS transporter [Chloroflexi bacterium]|nr:MFS transporter [Chloroflexota bacterium]
MNNIRLLTLISALTYVAVGITSPLIGLYLQSLGADYQHISLILASVVVVSLISSYIWGRISDKLGRRKPLLIVGLIILALAYVFLSRAANESWAWAARIFEGVGTAAYGTLSLAMMGDLLDKEQKKGQRMGWYRGLASAAFAIGSIMGGRLADLTSIAQTLQICSGLYLAAAICALALSESKVIKPLRPVTPTVSAPVTSQSGWNRGLPILFLVGAVLWTAAHTASASMWPNYMNTLGYSKTTIGNLWGFAAFIEFPAMRITGGLSDTLGRVPLLAAGGVGIALVNLGYLFLAQLLPFLLAVQVFRGFGYSSYTTNAMTYATENTETSMRGSRSGIYNATASAGSLLGTLLGGTLAQNFGFHFMYGMCATLALCSAVCFFMLRRQNIAARPLIVNN